MAYTLTHSHTHTLTHSEIIGIVTQYRSTRRSIDTKKNESSRPYLPAVANCRPIAYNCPSILIEGCHKSKNNLKELLSICCNNHLLLLLFFRRTASQVNKRILFERPARTSKKPIKAPAFPTTSHKIFSSGALLVEILADFGSFMMRT